MCIVWKCQKVQDTYPRIYNRGGQDNLSAKSTTSFHFVGISQPWTHTRGGVVPRQTEEHGTASWAAQASILHRGQLREPTDNSSPVPVADCGPGDVCPKDGRTQVNKAVHTCTSWYAYAATFGSSRDECFRHCTLAYVQVGTLCSPNYPHGGRVLSAKASSLYATLQGMGPRDGGGGGG